MCALVLAHLKAPHHRVKGRDQLGSWTPVTRLSAWGQDCPLGMICCFFFFQSGQLLFSQVVVPTSSCHNHTIHIIINIIITGADAK